MDIQNKNIRCWKYPPIPTFIFLALSDNLLLLHCDFALDMANTLADMKLELHIFMAKIHIISAH